MEGKEWAESWAMKWAEGTMLGFMLGRIEPNRALGMLRKAKEMIGGADKLYAIIENIERNPVYLPKMSKEEKAAKLNLLKRVLREEKYARSGERMQVAVKKKFSKVGDGK